MMEMKRREPQGRKNVSRVDLDEVRSLQEELAKQTVATRRGRQAVHDLLLKLHDELTDGEVRREVLDQLADDEWGRRSDAIPCLNVVRFLLLQRNEGGKPEVNESDSSERSGKKRELSYGTLRRYAAALQYGLAKSYDEFERQLARCGATELARRYDQKREVRGRYKRRRSGKAAEAADALQERHVRARVRLRPKQAKAHDWVILIGRVNKTRRVVEVHAMVEDRRQVRPILIAAAKKRKS